MYASAEMLRAFLADHPAGQPVTVWKTMMWDSDSGLLVGTFREMRYVPGQNVPQPSIFGEGPWQCPAPDGVRIGTGALHAFLRRELAAQVACDEGGVVVALTVLPEDVVAVGPWDWPDATHRPSLAARALTISPEEYERAIAEAKKHSA